MCTLKPVAFGIFDILTVRQQGMWRFAECAATDGGMACKGVWAEFLSTVAELVAG